MFDLLIKNGTIIDGSGESSYFGDLGVVDDKIKKIGDLHGEHAKVEIDASGKVVSPGFVDINNHSDTYWQIFLCPNQDSLVYQGITTIIGGNCGSSLAPLFDSKNIETIQKWADISKVNVNWLKTSEFLEVLEKRKIALNFGTLTGHGTLRRGVLGDNPKNPNPKEMSLLERKLKESISEGSFGMSTGLIYSHAREASIDEIIKLAKIVKSKNGVYSTHIREEGEAVSEALEEAIEIAQKSGVKLNISHLKVMGEKNWPKMKELLLMIEHAASKGVDINFDVFPYTFTGSVVYAFLPFWVIQGGKKMMLARLKEKNTKGRVIKEMRESKFDWRKIEISISPLNKTLARRKITDIARTQDKSVEETLLDLLVACEGRLITNMEVLSEENVRLAICHPLSFISSNGTGYDIEHKFSGEMVHPRSFGTFPRFFSKYVRNESLLSWEEGVRKITSAPAMKFGLKKRGLLKEGYFSDIVVFDKEKIEGEASRENPYQYSKGIEHVFVNGQPILFEGKTTGLRNGRVLRK